MSKSVFTKNKLKIFFIFLLSALLLAIGAAVGLYYHFGHALADSEPSEEMRGKMLYGNSFTVQELVDDTQYPYAWLSANATQVEVYAKNEQGESVLTTEVLSFDIETRTFRVVGVGEGVIRFIDAFDKTVTHGIPFKTSFRSADSLALLSENYPQFLDDGIIGEQELAAMQYLTLRDMQSVDLADAALWTGLKKLTIKNAVGAGLLEIANFQLPENTNIYVSDNDYLAYVNRTEEEWQGYAERIFPAPISLDKNSVVFYKNGGTLSDDNGVSCAFAQVAAGETLSITTDFAIAREGYTFVGWFLTPDGVTATGAALTDEYRFDTDAKVCAQWEAISYTVRAHHNNGTDASTEKTFVYDRQGSICDTPIEYNGYVQVGWAYAADATTPVFEPLQEVKNLTAAYNGVVDLYAVWVYQTFSVQFYTWDDAKTYKPYGSAKSVPFGDAISMSLTMGPPTSIYGSFEGWALTENASKALYAYNDSVDSSTLASSLTSNMDGILRVYSVIQLEAYDLSYDANGGSLTPNGEKALARGVSVNLHKRIDREGYKFKGWLDNAGWLWTSETMYANDEAYYNEKYPNREVLLETEYGYVAPRGMEHVQGSQVVLTAVWEVNTFSVVFTGNHSSAGYQRKTSAKYGRAFEFSYPVNVGHRITSFTGDYGNLTLSNSATELTGEQVNTAYCAMKAAQGVSDNDFDSNIATLTLSVGWTANTYRVWFNYAGGNVASEYVEVQYGKNYHSLPSPSRNDSSGDGGYYTYSFNGWYYYGTKITTSTRMEIAADHTLTADWSSDWIDTKNDCIADGTLVKMADGTSKKVEDLTVGESVLAWDFKTQQYVATPISLIVYHGDELADVLTFRFENGNSVRILGNHVFFDATLKKYVTVNADNYTEFVGHEFLAYDESGSYARTKLVSLDITQEYVGAYAIVTAYYYNAITDDMITCTPTISVYELISSYILDDLTFDTEQFEKDVAEYGLYEYALFDEYLSEEQFEQLCAAYFKISEGKGYTTYEQTYALMVAYGYIYQ